jgi:hypothetical protein
MHKNKEKYYPKIMNRLRNMSDTRTKNEYGINPSINDNRDIAKFIRYFQSPDSIYSNIYTRCTNVRETLKRYYQESVHIRMRGKPPSINAYHNPLIQDYPPTSYNQLNPPPLYTPTIENRNIKELNYLGRRPPVYRHI